ncbi:hypothetical protein [Sediminicola sp. 1XM1-17]|uniref:hypothetical protein n=1 Tax=Sediminicola sp. 1XM1-17 TaxID=3127702 RepID=UPI0030789629
MGKLIYKLCVSFVVVFLIIECLVRIFHLYSETPKRYIDEFGVEKRVPNQRGFNVTGNRRQHVTEFRINQNGFNTVNTVKPKMDSYEIALVGDSFIEGFHQPYKNSLGQMIESKLDSVKVLEYGIGGYDMADQMHLLHAYKKEFLNVDKIFLYLKFENDFERSYYEPDYDRISRANTILHKTLKSSKLFIYLTDIGLLGSVKNYISDKTKGIKNFNPVYAYNSSVEKKDDLEMSRISNFNDLIDRYGFDKTKTVLLYDGRQAGKKFIAFCNDQGIKYIDFSNTFKNAKKETTLIYDGHWNSYGRELLAETITDFIVYK